MCSPHGGAWSKGCKDACIKDVSENLVGYVNQDRAKNSHLPIPHPPLFLGKHYWELRAFVCIFDYLVQENND